MIIEITNNARKEFRKADKKLIGLLDVVLIDLKNTDSLHNFPNLKKMQGYKNKYRIKVNKHRLGLTLLDANTIEINRFRKRGDIYKFFPVLFSW